MYQRGATEADVIAYRDAHQLEQAAVDSPSTLARKRIAAITRWAPFLVGFALASVAASALIALTITPSEPRPASSATASALAVIAASQFLGSSEEAQAVRLLRRTGQGRVTQAQLGALAELVVPRLAPPGTSSPALARGTASGASSLPLGTIGQLAAGRQLRVVIATRCADFRWSVIDTSGHPHPPHAVSVRCSQSGPVSTASIPVPATVQNPLLRVELPPRQAFAYFLSVSP